MTKPIKTYDTNGNLTYRKDSNGYESWYDTKGNCTHYKNSNGYEWWRQYDTNGNCTYYKNSSGLEWWRQYDTNGNCTHFKNSNGCEWWKQYDTNGNCTYWKNSNGCESWYDTNGNCTHIKNSDGYEWWRQYDTNGNETHYKNSKDYEWWRQYDTNGNCIYFKDSRGKEEWYDTDGNVIDPPKPINSPEPETSTLAKVLTHHKTMIKPTLYTPKVADNSDIKTPDIPNSIDNLSLEEIEKLLPQFQASLEAAKKVPILDVVNNSFDEEWSDIECQMNQEFENNLSKDRMNFYLKTSLNLVLNQAIGEDLTKEFFKAVNYCQKEKNFKCTQVFFQKLHGSNYSEDREIAKISFATYRLNKYRILGDEYFGSPRNLKDTITKIRKNDSPLVQKVISQLEQLSLID